jgi:hypothetical protein
MKKIYLIPLLFISGFAFAQPAIKTYAYSQLSYPGTIPVGTDESGKSVEMKELPVNYYIFATHLPSARVNFGSVWIKGKYYQTQVEKVKETPVISTNYDVPSNPEKTVLVPATRHQVMSITPVGNPGDSVIRAAWFRHMVKNYELIISYYYKGKRYFIPVKKIKILPPVAGI